MRVEYSPGSPGFRRFLVLVGGLYIAAVFFEGAGVSLHRIMYRPLLFFCQIAALFPHAATFTIEYRAEGYTCKDNHIVEVDVRPFFPIHADDKENRFDRAMFFYRQHKPTMEALESYILRQHNGSDPQKIGGLILLSLRIPIPQPGTPFPRYARVPVHDYPKEERKVWYVTPHENVVAHCNELGP